MARTITPQPSDAAYQPLEPHARADNQSTSAGIEGLLDAGDIRRRCAAHDAFTVNNPDVVAFAEDWANRNLDNLTRR